MNKLLPITIFTLLFTVGCENFFGSNEAGDPYANDMLIYDLDESLALSEKQISDSRDLLRNGRDFFPDNTSLWKLALYLQQNLTEDQKERLLSPPEDLMAEEISEENDLSKDLVENLVDFYYKNVRTLLSELYHFGLEAK